MGVDGPSLVYGLDHVANLTNLADGVGMDVQERSDVLQVEVFHNAGTALHQQVVALAGRGTMEVDVAGAMLVERQEQLSAFLQNYIFTLLRENQTVKVQKNVHCTKNTCNER